MRHTKGPWKILKGHTGYDWFVCYHTRKIDNKPVQRAEVANVYKGPTLVKNHEEEGDALASIHSVSLNHRANKDANEAEALANAQLISASPELYQVTKLFLDMAISPDGQIIQGKELLLKVQDLARNAINKAEGKE